MSEEWKLHQTWMRRAIEIARQAPHAPFAALLVDDRGELIAAGINHVQDGPLWHGEIDAIDRAAKRKGVPWPSLTLYSTAEPCPMCQAAILWARIPRVVYGTSISFLKNMGWQQIDLSARDLVERTPFSRCELVGGVCENECNQLFVDAGKMK